MPRNVPKRNGSRRTPRHPTSFSRSAGSNGLAYILFFPAVVEIYVEIPNRYSESRARFPATFAMTQGCWDAHCGRHSAATQCPSRTPQSKSLKGRVGAFGSPLQFPTNRNARVRPRYDERGTPANREQPPIRGFRFEYQHEVTATTRLRQIMSSSLSLDA